jgi:hypothetical protein
LEDLEVEPVGENKEDKFKLATTCNKNEQQQEDSKNNAELQNK